MRRAMLVAAASAFVSMAIVFSLKTFADAAFLAWFGVEYIPHFLLAQAIGLVASSSAYSLAVRKVAPRRLDLVLIGTVLVIAAVGPFLIDLGGAAVFVTSLLMVTLSALASMAMWNAATSVVSGRRSRAFLPRIGAAASAGAVIGSFGSSAVVGALGVNALAWLAAALAIAGLALRGYLVRYTIVAIPAQAQRAAERSARAARGASRRLVTIMAAAAITEAILSALIEYGFKASVAERFSSEDALGVFFSLYYGVSNVLLLGLQLFTSSKLLATRSLRFSLTLEPAGLALLAFAWTLFPILAFGILTRGAESVMKFAVARPAQEVALTPLLESERRRWKVLLRGVYAQAGGAAAGLALIAAAPVLTRYPALTPALVTGIAAAWLWMQHRVATTYLTTLGSTLGLRKLSVKGERGELSLDREGIARVVSLAGEENDREARFARDLLRHFANDTAVLAPHVGTARPLARQTIYTLLTERPNRACAEPLQLAVAEETGPEILAAGLRACAAHGDQSSVERARKITADGAWPPESDLEAAAWEYLARVGALDDDMQLTRKVISETMLRDGTRAAALLRALAEREVIAWTAVDWQIEEFTTADDPQMRHQALRCAAVIGRTRAMVSILKALEADAPQLDLVIGLLDARALRRLELLMVARKASPIARERLLRALRGSDLHEAAELAGRWLTDARPRIRQLAARTLLHTSRHFQSGASRRTIESAISRQLTVFARYVRARSGADPIARESAMVIHSRRASGDAIDPELLFYDELERATERELSQLCSLLALLGDMTSVFAAERGLQSPSFKARRQALDILQEVVSGKQKAKLLDLLELYLMPSPTPSPDARAEVCRHDPWLNQCSSATADEALRKLICLRATPLFDHVEGEVAASIAERASEVEFTSGDTIVREGEPGDALYILQEGALDVVRHGRTVAQLAPGQAFGELALVDGQPRQATVRAAQASRLLKLTRDEFDSAWAEHPQIGLGLVRGLAGWLRQPAPTPSATTSTS